MVCHASRLGRRQRRGPPHQDVHRDDRGGLRRDPPRARATTSTSAPTGSSRILFRNGANDGFHEAIGDAIALSVTPEYLVKVGPARPGPRRARATSACSSRGPSRRWPSCPSACSSTSGGGRSSRARSSRPTTTRRGGTCAQRYQGVAPPVARGARATSTPGPSTTCRPTSPYTRYFLAHILQFQFHRALCRAAGQTGPLHRCSIYGNKAAGEKLEQDAGHGPEPTLAGGARGAHRRAAHGRRRAPRVLRAAAAVARRAEPREEVGW